MAFEHVTLAVELVKTVVWPITIGWIAWYYRSDVKLAAGRLIEASLTGVKFSPAPPSVQIATTVAASVPGLADPQHGSSEQGGPEIAANLEKGLAEIKQFISADQLVPIIQYTREELLKNLGSNKDAKIEFLFHLAAAMSLAHAHAATYQVIFGSQLRALRLMNNFGGADLASVRSIYDEAVKTFPEFYQAIDFEKWSLFLFQSNLCILDQAGRYQITPRGRGLLKYILDKQLPERFG
jgi:hypothetical protein